MNALDSPNHVNTIFIGSVDNPTFTFNAQDIMNLSSEISSSLDGSEVAADVFDVEVQYDDAGGHLRALGWATPIFWFANGTQIAKFYITKVTRTARTAYHLEATSMIGLLEYQKFYGGMYYGETFQDVFSGIVLTSGQGLTGYDKAQYFRSLRYYPEFFEKPLRYECDSIRIYCEATAPTRATFSTDDPVGSTISFNIFGKVSDDTGTTRGDYGARIIYTKTTASQGNVTTGRVIFVHDGQVILTIASYSTSTGKKITADIDPMNGTIKVRVGTGSAWTYTATFTPNSPSRVASVYYWPGGYRDTQINVYRQTYYCYRVYNAQGVLLFDPALGRDAQGNGYLIDMVTNETHEVPLGASQTDKIEGFTWTASTLGLPPELQPPNSSEYTNFVTNATYASQIDQIRISGWLPITTKREALHQLLFAANVNLLKDANGNVSFEYLSNDIEQSIDESDVYMDGTVEYADPVNSVSLTVHSFDSVQDNATVFDNTDEPALDVPTLVELSNAPIYGFLDISDGLTILCYNANIAVLSGRGEITGIPLFHGRKAISENIGTRPDGQTISVDNATLVNKNNSENVLKKLLAYYRSPFKIHNAIPYDGQKTGRKYSVYNSFLEQANGFLAKMSLQASSFIKAACDFACEMVAADYTGEYTHSVLLTGSGTWDVPAEVLAADNPKFMVILVGGGTGGQGGYAGANGAKGGNQWASTSPAQGGAVGAPGTGGKIFQTLIQNPQYSSYNYSCGIGGTGGAGSTNHRTTNDGTDGGDTTFSDGAVTLTSADGERSEGGLLDIFTGIVVGKTGTKWPKGSGNGGAGGYYEISGNSVIQHDSEMVYNFIGKAKTIRTNNYLSGEPLPANEDESFVTGSGAGGAACPSTATSTTPPLQSGTEGWDGRFYLYLDNQKYYVFGNHGGDGANAAYIPAKASNGCGGMGGCGGGGGGAAGCYRTGTYNGLPVLAELPSVVPAGGNGGQGSKGGDGGDGCILIYW